MPSRTSFIELRHLTAGQDGGFNQGILIIRHRRTGTCYVEKRVSPRAIRTGHAAREARALRSCHHPHIISLVFADLDAAGYGYGSNCMSYCELGSLDGDTSDVYSLALSVYCVAALRDTPRLGEIVRADPAPGYSRELRGVLGRMLRLMPEDRVEVGHLPYLVWREMSVVKHERAARGFQSEKMPSWAFWE
ncbi:hypothetical protein DPSP01_008790 [Paraphaeosphaeria sporulosa]